MVCHCLWNSLWWSDFRNSSSSFQNSFPFCFFSNRMSSWEQNGYFHSQCLHVWCTRHFGIGKSMVLVQERGIYWWNRAKSKSRDRQKERSHIKSRWSFWGEYCSFCDKVVSLISRLTIISKRIYSIWIYWIIMSSLFIALFIRILPWNLDSILKFKILLPG